MRRGDNARRASRRTHRRFAPMPLERWLILRRWQRRAVGGAVALVVAVLLWRGGWRPWMQASQPTRIVGVVQAVRPDMTLAIESSSERSWRVRLVGLRHPRAWREPARRWLRDTIVGRAVIAARVKGGASPWGARPGAAIDAWVYTDAGRLINERMVDAGYATIDPTARHALAAWLAQVRDWAHADRRGLWGRTGLLPGDERPVGGESRAGLYCRTFWSSGTQFESYPCQVTITAERE